MCNFSSYLSIIRKAASEPIAVVDMMNSYDAEDGGYRTMVMERTKTHLLYKRKTTPSLVNSLYLHYLQIFYMVL